MPTVDIMCLPTVDIMCHPTVDIMCRPTVDIMCQRRDPAAGIPHVFTVMPAVALMPSCVQSAQWRDPAVGLPHVYAGGQVRRPRGARALRLLPPAAATFRLRRR